ncbi:MAG: hypothetical protein JO154_25945 [Chitinophaga sp.]|uniref:hypothetical protein n=1 Tax=Chitinophaga sp. TaxID=1869181 RepID=UPI0025C5E288|nr:hypothetical protein [Chitinophaga sp.]MBV8256065.1 hypothetical protein [Chitinophaga sp.]
MSRIKDYMIELQQQKIDERIAQKLGLTLEEFEEYIESQGVDESEDGLVYGFYFHFNEEMPEEVRNKIIGLENNSVFVDPYFYEDEMSYYDEQYDAIHGGGHDSHFYETEFENLRKLNAVETGNEQLNSILRRQVYIAAIGVTEAFLSSTFISRVMESDTLLKKYIETTPAFKERKFAFAEVFDAMGKLKEIAKQEMLDVIYHNLPVVRGMFHDTFGIDFPPIGEVMKCIAIRHHLVHRNGKTKDGDLLDINATIVADVIDKTFELCNDVNAKLNSSPF